MGETVDVLVVGVFRPLSFYCQVLNITCLKLVITEVQDEEGEYPRLYAQFSMIENKA